MSKYFDKFPTILYDMEQTKTGNYTEITNLFIRTKILDAIKNNSFLYYEYSIKDGDTPEIIAHKYYNDVEMHWVVLMANDRLDAQYDWPLNYDAFNKYIIGKYGSLVAAQSKIDHYEKNISRTDSRSGLTTQHVIYVDVDAYNALPTSSFATYNLNDGTTVSEIITKKIVYCYNKELEDNDKKRPIKLIKKEYVNRIYENLQDILNSTGNIESIITE